MNILLVDDDDFYQILVGEYCKEFGHKFSYLKNGINAVECAIDGKAHVVLLDILMDGKEGLSTLKDLKIYCPAIPVYTISSDEFYLDMSIELGACGSILKPVTYDNMTSVLNGQKRDCIDCRFEGQGLGRCGRQHSAHSG